MGLMCTFTGKTIDLESPRVKDLCIR
ncbi:hypothetical protein LCGC14_1261030, partial [marine sediment metagenome]